MGGKLIMSKEQRSIVLMLVVLATTVIIFISTLVSKQALDFKVIKIANRLSSFHSSFRSRHTPTSTCPNGTAKAYSPVSYRDPYFDDPHPMPIAKYRTTDDYCYCPFTTRIQSPPSPFLAESKNPCWREPSDGRLRCLPYFYLAGFSKCATSDAFNRISEHPQLLQRTKEIHWHDYFQFMQFNNYLSSYTDHFAQTAKEIDRELIKSGTSQMIIGDGTPAVLWYSLHWRCYDGNQGLEEPLITNADLVYNHNPKAKIIVMVREPASRLYSRYLSRTDVKIPDPHYDPMNAGPEAFHALVLNGITKYTDCIRRWSPRHCAYNGTLYTEVFLRLQEGMYSIYLKDWYKLFPRSQILVIRYEDYIDDLETHLQKIFDFLGLSPLLDRDMKDIVNDKPYNVGRHKNLGDMLPKTRKLLEDFYQPFVQELAQIQNNDAFLWNYDRPSGHETTTLDNGSI